MMTSATPTISGRTGSFLTTSAPTGAASTPPMMSPTALLRSDTRRLMDEVKGAFRTVRQEQQAARAAGRAPASCTPDRVPVNTNELLARFNAIPAARRDISVTQAIREWMVERYPCPN